MKEFDIPQTEDPHEPELSPDRRLLLRMIAQAINDTKISCYRASALRWIFGESTKLDGLFTFEYCCEELDLDPNVIRAYLKNNKFKIAIRFRNSKKRKKKEKV